MQRLCVGRQAVTGSESEDGTWKQSVADGESIAQLIEAVYEKL